MKLLMIALLNTYLGCYESPQTSNLTKENIKEQYHRSVMMDPDGAFKARVNEKTVCILGEFDDLTGEITPYKTPEKLLDLVTCFPRGYIAKKEALARQEEATGNA